MLRKFLELVIGVSPSIKNPVEHAKPSVWREAPTKTMVDEVGGVVLTMAMNTGHHGFIAVVGESHYQDAIRRVSKRVGPAGIFRARLVPEPQNPFDSSAVAVCDDESLEKLGHLAREVAKSYQSRIIQCPETISCPAKITGGGEGFGIVLDFEEVRVKLGLPPVSVDLAEMDFEAATEYHRVNNANRKLVASTKALEKSDTAQAIAHYRQALITLSECRKLAEARGLLAYGFKPNQTDALPVERLTMCLIRLNRVQDAVQVVDEFVAEFPHASEMSLITAAKARIQRALSNAG